MSGEEWENYMSEAAHETQSANVGGNAGAVGDSVLATVSVRNVTKNYGAVRALDAVNIDMYSGEVHGIIGENGAGKSTLVGVITGSVACDRGVVLLSGEALGRWPVQEIQERGVRIVHQTPGIEPDLTVAENIALWLQSTTGDTWRGINKLASETLSIWGPDTAKEIVPEMRGWALSQAQRTVVALCSALAAKPKVLILDEPTEHLRGPDVDRLFSLIGSLRGNGVAVGYISHRLNDVTKISDRITVLRGGKTVGTYIDRLSDSEMIGLITGKGASGRSAGISKEVLHRERQVAEPNEALVLRHMRFGNGTESDVQVARGEIIGVTGMAGAGQEQLLRQLAGLETKRGNASRIDFKASGGIVDTPRKARQLGVHLVSGDRGLEGVFPGLAVRENGTFRSLRRLRQGPFISPGAEARFVTTLIEDFNVRPGNAELPIEALSGGNQQKVALGAALNAECRVLLLEEPVQGLDVVTREQIFEMLRRKAKEERVTVVIATTDSSDLVGLADKVLVMSRGEVLTTLVSTEISEGRIAEAIVTASNAGRNEESGKRVRRGTRWGRRLMRSGGDGQVAPVVLLAAVVIVIGAIGQTTNGLFLSHRNTSSMLQVLLPYAFAAFGEAIVLLQGGFDLSIGPLMGVDLAIASFFFVAPLSAGSMIVGVVILVGVSAGVGLFNWALVEFARLESMIATLITYVLLEGVGLVLRPVPGGQVASSVAGPLTSTLGEIPVLTIVAVVLGLVISVLVGKSRVGRELRALGSDRRVAVLMGVKSRRLRLGAYLVSAGCGLLGGVALMGQVAYGDSTVGVAYTLAGLSAVVIGGVSISGGIGGLVGPLLGALLLAEVLSLGAFLRAGGWLPYVLSGGVTIIGVLGYSVLRKYVRSRYAA